MGKNKLDHADIALHTYPAYILNFTEPHLCILYNVDVESTFHNPQ
jgi:hypothetical protein